MVAKQHLILGCLYFGFLPLLNASWHTDKLFSVSYTSCYVNVNLFIHIYRSDHNFLVGKWFQEFQGIVSLERTIWQTHFIWIWNEEGDTLFALFFLLCIIHLSLGEGLINMWYLKYTYLVMFLYFLTYRKNQVSLPELQCVVATLLM